MEQKINQAIKDALSNNLSIQSEILKEEKQYSKVEQANKLWKPTVDLNASYLCVLHKSVIYLFLN